MWRPHFVSDRTYYRATVRTLHRLVHAEPGWYPYNPKTHELLWTAHYYSKSRCRERCDLLNGQQTLTELLEGVF